MLEEIKIKIKDLYHLIFTYSADNHLRIQKCKRDKNGKIRCNVSFDSYIDLKNYQKSLRRKFFLSVCVAALLLLVMLAIFAIVVKILYPTFGMGELVLMLKI